MNSRSELRLGIGLAGSAALREAIASERYAHPFSRAEALAAAAVISRDQGLPKDWLSVGICLDLLAASDANSRRSMRRALGIDAGYARAMETAWEALQPQTRIDLVRVAVRIVMARRLGGAS